MAPQDAGVASATVTVGQQLGASVGTSLLNTIFAAAVTSYLLRPGPPRPASTPPPAHAEAATAQAKADPALPG